jgi:hypothetical protein
MRFSQVSAMQGYMTADSRQAPTPFTISGIIKSILQLIFPTSELLCGGQVGNVMKSTKDKDMKILDKKFISLRFPI